MRILIPTLPVGLQINTDTRIIQNPATGQFSLMLHSLVGLPPQVVLWTESTDPTVETLDTPEKLAKYTTPVEGTQPASGPMLVRLVSGATAGFAFTAGAIGGMWTLNSAYSTDGVAWVQQQWPVFMLESGLPGFVVVAAQGYDKLLYIVIAQDGNFAKPLVRLREAGGKLELVEVTPQFLTSRIQDGPIAPHGELPPMQWQPDPHTNTLLLTYPNNCAASNPIPGWNGCQGAVTRVPPDLNRVLAALFDFSIWQYTPTVMCFPFAGGMHVAGCIQKPDFTQSWLAQRFDGSTAGATTDKPLWNKNSAWVASRDFGWVFYGDSEGWWLEKGALTSVPVPPEPEPGPIPPEPPGPVLTPPSNLTATVHGRVVGLAWSNTAFNEDEWEVWYSMQRGGGPWSAFAPQTTVAPMSPIVSLAFGALKKTSYKYKVCAVAGDTKGAFSNVVQFRVN